MLCNVLLSWMPRSGRLLAGLVLFCFLATAPFAFADRIVYFDTIGHSEIVSGGTQVGYYNPTPGQEKVSSASNLKSKCIITITNSSTKDQKINMTVSPTTGATGTPSAHMNGTPTPTASNGSSAVTWPFVDYLLTPNSQLIVTIEFPPAWYLEISTQDVHCAGSISVKDSDPLQPGFVVANGMLSTWSQGSSAYQATGTGILRAQVRYFYNPFTIGSGRAF